MPIWEYQCRMCGAVSEFIMGKDGEETIVCRECGSAEMERILSPTTLMNRPLERASGRTCCGREERCDKPPCAGGGSCRRDPG